MRLAPAATIKAIKRRAINNDCGAEHYTAFAIPVAPDGSQGRALCSSESVEVRVAEDGKPRKCLSTGAIWNYDKWVYGQTQTRTPK